MGNPIKKVTLKALEAVRIRVDGEKQNFEAGDLIEVAENVSGYYLRNGFWFEKDELKPVIEKEIEEELEKEDETTDEVEEESELEKETTEITDPDNIEIEKEEQAEKAKAETKKAKTK